MSTYLQERQREEEAERRQEQERERVQSEALARRQIKESIVWLKTLARDPLNHAVLRCASKYIVAVILPQ